MQHQRSIERSGGGASNHVQQFSPDEAARRFCETAGATGNCMDFHHRGDYTIVSSVADDVGEELIAIGGRKHSGSACIVGQEVDSNFILKNARTGAGTG